jgi:RNA polymerase sigma-70 factor, ECF subfamily
VEGGDTDVQELIASGDREAALSLLMQRHGDAIYQYCCAALEDEALADDVLQQVFIAAFRDFDRFTGRSSLRAWLFGVARHRVLDHKRVQKRARARTRPLKETAPDVRPLAGERLDQARLLQALTECLDTLGEHIRTALFLRFQQGFSFEAMADICREKPGTLQARVARALPILRDCIQARTKGEV